MRMLSSSLVITKSFRRPRPSCGGSRTSMPHPAARPAARRRREDLRHRALRESPPVAVGNRERPPQRHLHAVAEHDRQQQRRRVELRLAQHVADRAEDAHDHDLARVRVDAVDPDHRHEQHARRQVEIGNPQDVDEQADQRQIQDQQHDVADVHAGDQPPEHVGMLADQLRTGLDAVNLQRGQQDGRRGNRRDAEHQQRNHRAAGRRIVGGLRSRDTLDLAGAERLGLARQLALHRVAHERGDDVRDPGNEAEHEPDHRAAADRRRRILEILEARDQAAQRRLDDLDLGDFLEVDQDFADAEEARARWPRS